MKSIPRLVLFALPALLLVTSITMAKDEQMRSISVSGTSEIKVVPDEVQLLIGVESFHEDMEACKKENDNKTAAVLAAAKKLGVSDEFLKTDYIELDPEQEWRAQKLVHLGYRLRRTISVTLRDVSKFEMLLQTVLTAGATHIHSVQFNTTELRKHRDEAREQAVIAAKEKAVALAGGLDMEVGLPTSIQESSGWNYYPYSSWYWGGGQGYMMQNSSYAAPANSGGGSENGTVALGRISVSATVNITFEMKAEE